MFDISPTSNANRFRQARLALLGDLIHAVLAHQQSCRILDVGGTGVFWNTWGHLIDWDRVDVTCLNLPGATPRTNAHIHTIFGDARAMPEIDRGSYDICFSNSVIEHVGLWSDMAAMAGEIRRIAPTFMVQTPNYWFPIEPHARTPFLHWLPEPLACRVVMARRCGFWARAETMDQAMRAVQSARLLGPRQMGALFPDAVIRRERAFGLSKALIAVRTGHDPS